MKTDHWEDGVLMEETGTLADLNNLYGLTTPSDQQWQTCARPDKWR